MPQRGNSDAYRQQIHATKMRIQMIARGWCASNVPSWLLDELGIPNERSVVDLTRWLQQNVCCAPAWVYGVWLRARTRNPWDEVRARLKEVQARAEEQLLICTELSFDDNLTQNVREAARNCATIAAAALLKEKEEGSHVQNPSKD